MLPIFSKRNARYYPSYLRNNFGKDDSSPSTSTESQNFMDIRTNILHYVSKNHENQFKETESICFEDQDNIFACSQFEEKIYNCDAVYYTKSAIEPTETASGKLTQKFPNFKFSKLNKNSKRCSNSSLDETLENYQLPNKFVGFKWQKLSGQFKHLMYPDSLGNNEQPSCLKSLNSDSSKLNIDLTNCNLDRVNRSNYINYFPTDNTIINENISNIYNGVVQECISTNDINDRVECTQVQHSNSICPDNILRSISFSDIRSAKFKLHHELLFNRSASCHDLKYFPSHSPLLKYAEVENSFTSSNNKKVNMEGWGNDFETYMETNIDVDALLNNAPTSLYNNDKRASLSKKKKVPTATLR